MKPDQKASHKTTKTASSRPICSSKIAEWPNADRNAWLAATVPRVRLHRGGAASHMKQNSQQDLQRRYGYFLDHLKSRDALDLAAPAGALVTPQNVQGYIEELQARVSSVTLSRSIDKLARMTKLLSPLCELSWLSEIAKELAYLARPHSKISKVVDSARIVNAGLAFANEAMTQNSSPTISSARQVRNGLMIALLALCPIRLKNYAALELGKSFVFDGSQWWIILGAEETKSGRPDERPVPEILNELIESYLLIHRNVLLRIPARTAQTDAKSSELLQSNGPLWIESNHGHKMSYARIGQAVADTTCERLGKTLRPHMFRVCAASSVAYIASDTPHLASALLQHSDPRVTEKYYNRASSIRASLIFAELVTEAANPTSTVP